jgi:F-type H+-transporting ATPase subunit alpha
VISITDGQIFLENSLFNAGIRPAINVGISVSRVGGNAQIKAMKKIAGTLKTDQAQYRELEAFTKFGGDMDPVTRMTLDKGKKNAALLIQPQYHPLCVEKEIALIFIGTKGLLFDIPVEKVREFAVEYLQRLELKYRKEVLDVLQQGILNEEVEKLLTQTANELVEEYKVKG